MSYLPLFSLETWILLITVICLFVMYGYWTHGIFDKLGIPGPKPYIYFGTIARHDQYVFCNLYSVCYQVYYMDDHKSAMKYGKLWGAYEFRRPVLFVMDPDMLKTILVKECLTYFTNRRDLRLTGELYDAVSMAEDDQWRRIRHTLSPWFASGHMKAMFRIMKNHSQKLINQMRSKADKSGVIIVKDFFGPYSMDVMGNCAFGLDLNCINNPSSPFITHASQLFNFSLPLIFIQGFFPFLIPLLQLLGFSLFSKTSMAFFKTFMEKFRGEYDKTSNQVWTKRLSDHEILSQSTMFLFAGYETSATTLVFLAYNLARNPDIMKRLQQEIDTTFPNKSPVHYEGLLQMEYLDSVISESLRLYPPAARLERVTKETIRINGTTIPKDMMIVVPVYALHRDPELWPEPEQFKPERFNNENKHSIRPYTYLPFGIGPRNCVGMRFALLMVKLGLVEVLQNYSFSVCEETEDPLTMDPKGLLAPKRPIKLRLETRSSTSGNEDI
uniref:unspecific monooxygenase n=1 Tax=Sphaeramia orbicularis TaxID=375764 RepID=A0A672ZIU4_9TELE